MACSRITALFLVVLSSGCTGAGSISDAGSEVDSGSNAGGNAPDSGTNCSSDVLEVRFSNPDGTVGDCVQWGTETALSDSSGPIIHFDWGPDSGWGDEPNFGLFWSSGHSPHIQLAESVEDYELDGCPRRRAVISPERFLAALEYTLEVFPQQATSGSCPPFDGAVSTATLIVSPSEENPEFSFCGDDRPTCSSGADCPDLWVCNEQMSRCEVFEEEGCISSDDPTLYCQTFQGDQSSKCWSVSEEGGQGMCGTDCPVDDPNACQQITTPGCDVGAWGS